MPVFIRSLERSIKSEEKRAIRRLVQEVLTSEGERGEVSILLTDNKMMENLNWKYRYLSSPTDVLSFPQDLPDLLGDIAISMDMVEKEASLQGITPLKVLLVFVLHGLLHLLGYDHEKLEDALIMEKKEEDFKKRFFPGERE